MNHKVIRAEPQHLFWLRMLWEELAKESPIVYPERADDDIDNFTREVAVAMQDPNNYFAAFLAIKGKRAIGFTGGAIQYRPVGAPHWYLNGYWLYVRPEHRSKGVGAILVRELARWSREYQFPVHPPNSHHTACVESLEFITAYKGNKWSDSKLANELHPILTTYMTSITDLLDKKSPSGAKETRYGERRRSIP